MIIRLDQRELYFNISTSRPPSPKFLQTVSAVGSSTDWSLRSGRTQPRPTDVPSAQPSGQSPWPGLTKPWSRDLRATSSRPLRSISSFFSLCWDFFGRPEMRARLRRRIAREVFSNILLSTITLQTLFIEFFYLFRIYLKNRNGYRKYLYSFFRVLFEEIKNE